MWLRIYNSSHIAKARCLLLESHWQHANSTEPANRASYVVLWQAANSSLPEPTRPYLTHASPQW